MTKFIKMIYCNLFKTNLLYTQKHCDCQYYCRFYTLEYTKKFLKGGDIENVKFYEDKYHEKLKQKAC